MCIQCGWAFGYCILPGIAYALPNFRYLILATSIPEVFWLIWLWTIPESPRWLITHKKLDKAENEMLRAVEKNGLSKNDIESKFEILRKNFEQEEEKLKIERKSTVLDLLKTPNLRQYTIVLYLTWFVNSFVYYGISLNIGDFGGNLFLSFLIAGIIEFPSYLFPVLAFRYIGRRTLTAALMYGSGLACFGTIPFIYMSKVWLRITVAMIGKFFITSSYGIIYVYAAEIYPTVVRQAGVGSCSVAARFGSIIAPFVKDLVFIETV
jgi:OCT family organic cation transporter-like MFS transporter 4/5